MPIQVDATVLTNKYGRLLEYRVHDAWAKQTLHFGEPQGISEEVNERREPIDDTPHRSPHSQGLLLSPLAPSPALIHFDPCRGCWTNGSSYDARKKGKRTRHDIYLYDTILSAQPVRHVVFCH